MPILRRSVVQFCSAPLVRFHTALDKREGIDLSRSTVRRILGSLAEFELELIRERVKAGMDRARRQGKRIGRPRVTDRRGFDRRFGAILERLSSGELSRR